MELFLDSNAHMPMTGKALQAYADCQLSLAGHGHPMSPSAPGRKAEAKIEAARDGIAKILGAKDSSQIVFTSTCTQACEWGLEIFNTINKDRGIYLSSGEHPAISLKVKSFGELSSRAITIPFTNEGIIDLDYPMPRDSGTICIHVNNETGVIQPIDKIYSKSLFSDMSQSVGKMNINLSSINNLDIAVFGAHKFGGPASVGIMYLKDVKNWYGRDSGSRYFLDRAGTPDVCSVCATEVALREAYKTLPDRRYRAAQFTDVVQSGLEELGFIIIGKGEPRVPGTIFARVPKGIFSNILLLKLSAEKIYIGLGSACGSANPGASPYIKAIARSLSRSDVEDGARYEFVRISNYGHYGAEEGEFFIKKVKDCL